MSGAKAKKLSAGNIAAIIALIISLILLCYSISSRIITQRQEEKRIQQEKKFAEEYLHYKYGMEAEFIDVSLNNLIPETSMVHMKYEDREFNVQINNRQAIRYISDDYQYEEIEKAFLDKIEESLPGGYNYRCNLYYSPKHSILRYITMSGMDDVFDGTNLDEIMKNKSGDITMLYVDTEFNDCEFFDWIQKYRIDAMFVSFDSPESFNEAAGQNYTFIFSSAKDWLIKFGDHITDIREVKS